MTTAIHKVDCAGCAGVFVSKCCQCGGPEEWHSAIGALCTKCYLMLTLGGQQFDDTTY